MLFPIHVGHCCIRDLDKIIEKVSEEELQDYRKISVIYKE